MQRLYCGNRPDPFQSNPTQSPGAWAAEAFLDEEGQCRDGPGGGLASRQFAEDARPSHLPCPSSLIPAPLNYSAVRIAAWRPWRFAIIRRLFAKVSAATFQQARNFLESFELLAPGMATAAIYGRLRAQLALEGRQLPDPDYWIAAHALENRLPLVSTDRDFEHIPDLILHYLPPR